jgi:hypothetical protein
VPGTAERVVALSPAKLALVNLRMRDRTDGGGRAADTHAAAHAGTAPPASIVRHARRSDADLLDQLDGMSDAEIDRLLRQRLGEQAPAAAPRPAEGAGPGAIPRVARDREVQLLADLEGLSDAEVDSLVRDLTRNVSAGSQ